MESLMKAYLDDYGKVTVLVSNHFYQGKCDNFYLSDDASLFMNCVIRNVVNQANDTTRYDLTIIADLDLEKHYYIMDNHGQRVELEYRFIVKNPKFDDMFAYNGDDLGSFYHRDYTDFALWAPTAHEVYLEIENKGEIVLKRMERTAKGVYRFRVFGNLKNATYVYCLNINGQMVRTVDPYSLSFDANSKRTGVIDTDEIKINKVALPLMKNPTDAIIYETSVRDFTASLDTGTKTHSKFVSMTEDNTNYKGYKTGLSYLKDLGITHVQLMPIFDFACVDELHPEVTYNWGYNPLNHFAIEGSYSTNPNDPYTRVKEFTQLVNTMHKNGIRVVVDLVLNHVYDVALSALDKTVPYYYFRFNEQGYYSNGSYCGNDINSTRAMCRKYLIDNIKSWLIHYDVDGFRFDLMGIIDIDTMNMITSTGKSIKPDSIYYGEGWNLPTALAEDKKTTILNSYQVYDVGFFNDTFRDTIKGPSQEGSSWIQGYATGNDSAVTNMVAAMSGGIDQVKSLQMFLNPMQSINYAECHDNQTAWDKMKDCCKDDVREVRIEKQKLIIACTIFAQGVPFLHSGMEFCRTKLGNHNTYNITGKINEIDWDRMVKYYGVVEYTKQCIATRKKYEGFRLPGNNIVRNEVSFKVGDNNNLLYFIKHPQNDIKEIVVIINPTSQNVNHLLGDEYKAIFTNEGIVAKEKSENFVASPYSLSILVK